MALKHGADMPQALQFLLVKIAPLRQSGIKARSAVALGKHKTVPVRIFGILGINVHFLEIEIGEEIGRRERASRVAGFGVEHAFDDAEANLRRGDLKVFPFLSVHGLSPFLSAVFLAVLIQIRLYPILQKKAILSFPGCGGSFSVLEWRKL